MNYGGKTHFFGSCPSYGRYEVNPEKLKQWTLSCQGLARVLSSLINANNTEKEIISGRLWNLGSTGFGSDFYEILMVRGLSWPDATSLSLNRYAQTAAVILTLGGMPHELPLSTRVISLSNVLSLGPDTLSLDNPRLISVLRSAQKNTSDDENTFIREGDHWRIRFEKKNITLKHLEGLIYIAHLLSRPGQEIDAIELASLGSRVADISTSPASRLSAAEIEETGLSVAGFSDAGAAIDAKTAQQCRDRLDSIEKGIRDAKDNYDHETIEKLEDEKDKIMDYLKLTTGLGGRIRKVGSGAEKARISVKVNITRAVKALREQDKALGQFFDQSVNTGNCCCYSPVRKIPWKLS